NGRSTCTRPPVRGRRRSLQPSERAREVTLVREAAGERDVGEREPVEELLRAPDALFAGERPDGAPVVPPERAREVCGMDAGFGRELAQRGRLPERPLQPLARAREPPGRSRIRPLARPVRGREELEDEAFERERRDVVPEARLEEETRSERGDLSSRED